MARKPTWLQTHTMNAWGSVVSPGRPVATKPPWTPFVAQTNPPPGTYDPSLDAQLAATQRGYGDLQTDTGIQNQRAQDDFNLQSGHLADLLQQHLADLSTGRDRAHQSYLDATAGIQRDFTNLASAQQGQAAAAGGFGAGGALQQALQKRMANQALAQAPVDRAEQNNVTDYNTAVTRANQGENFDIGQLGLQLSRGNEDRANQLQRAGRETTQMGVDVGSQRWYQAGAMGYDPGQKPANEHTDPKTGQTYRLIRTKRGLRWLLPTGQVIARGGGA